MANFIDAMEECVNKYEESHPEFFIGDMPYPYHWVSANVSKFDWGKTKYTKNTKIIAVLERIKEDWITINSKWNVYTEEFDLSYVEDEKKTGSNYQLIVGSNKATAQKHSGQIGVGKWAYNNKTLIIGFPSKISSKDINVFFEDHEQQLKLLAVGLEWYTANASITQGNFKIDELLPSVQAVLKNIENDINNL